MKTIGLILCCSLHFVVTAVASKAIFITQAPAADKWDPAVTQIVESKPITVKDVRFVAAVERVWALYPTEIAAKIELQLLVTNLGRNTLDIATYDTWRVRMKNAAGKELLHQGGRDWSQFTRPIRLSPGSTFALTGKARFKNHLKEPKGQYFDFADDTGNLQSFGPLEPGTYHLRITFDSTGKNARGPAEPAKGIPVWIGRVETNAVEIVITNREIEKHMD